MFKSSLTQNTPIMEIENQSENEKVTLLMHMGFSDVDIVKRALRASGGDINEAVSVLTENSMGSYDTKEDLSKVTDETWTTATEFPSSVARSLHERVFADSWNIPYKRNEALGQCLLAATSLARQGLCQSDNGCRRFFDELLPECFSKLLDAGAVRRWPADVQEGVFNMIELLLDLSVAVLQCPTLKPHPGVLTALAEAFSSRNEFHNKNRYRASQFKATTLYAVSPENDYNKHGWLVDILNMFGERGGFDILIERLSQEDLSLPEVASMMKPFSTCSRFLSRSVVWPSLCPIVERVVARLTAMTEADLKSSDAERCFQLLESCQHVCAALWPDQLERVASLRFHLIYTMIKLPHFSARINALKGLSKLISDSEKARLDRQVEMFDIDYVQNWMTEKKVLFYALDGNLDQIQYTERMRELMDTLAPKLRQEDLARIWQLVERAASPQVVDNIHAMLEVAAKKFSPMQFEHILQLVCKSFDGGNERLQEKLLTFLGNIGRDNRLGRTAESMLDVVWELARRPELPGPLVDRAMNQHLNILSHSATRDALRRNYMLRCIADISRSPAVYLPLKQLLVLAQSLTKGNLGYFKTEKSLLSELCRQQQLVKLVSTSLGRCHQLAVQERGGRPPLPTTLIDGKYSHQEYLSVHMELIQFLLKEGDLYLSSVSAKDIWDTLVANPAASTHDQETCFQMLCTCLEDLESGSQREVLVERLLHLPPASLSPPSYTCLLAYWRAVNEADRKLVKGLDNEMIVESLELLGHDYFWRIVLECTHREIVNEAANVLLNLAYSGLSPKLKRVPASLHQRFIKECHRRLDKILCQLNSGDSSCGGGGESVGGGASVVSAVTTATNTLTAMAVTDGAEITPQHEPKWLLVQVERLVCLAREYIYRVECQFASPRSVLPHAATFHGLPILLTVTCNSPSIERNISSHSHESVRDLRQRVFAALQSSSTPVSLDQITQLVFIRPKLLREASDTTGSSGLEYFSIRPSKGSPLLYKHTTDEEGDNGTKKGNGGVVVFEKMKLRSGNQTGIIGSGRHMDTVEEEEGKQAEEYEKILVTLGEKDNAMLCELGIDASCELRLTVNTGNKSAHVKEVSYSDSWNELPGPASYSDTKEDVSSTFSSAVVPYSFGPAKTSTQTSDSPSSSTSSGSSKPGLLERMQGVARGGGAGGGAAGNDGSEEIGGAGAAAASSKLDIEKSLPGLLMAEKGSEVFEMLFRLGKLEDCRVIESARRLLHVIPTHAELLDKLDIVGNGASASASERINSEGNSPVSSPAKREKLRDKEGPSPQLTLQRLLDASQPGMSPFRLLYNLEALSSKLVQLGVGVGEDGLNKKFCAELLRCGGLRLLWSLLEEGRPNPHRPHTTLNQAQPLIYRKIHYQVLNILKHLICGPGVREEASFPEDPLSSAEPFSFLSSTSSTAGFGQPTSSALPTPAAGSEPGSSVSAPSRSGPPCLGPARPMMMILTEADWLTLVCAVMRSVWPGATSKLFLPPSATEGAAGPEAAPTESAATAGNSPDIGGVVHAGGVCDLNDVSGLEANITSLALSVLVAILAIRSNLLGSWYSLPGLRQYLLELVLGCSSQVVRGAACRHLTVLTQLNTNVQPHPKLFISQVLVKAPLPLWVSTSHARGAALKIISQSLEYFKLRSYLLSRLSPEVEASLGVSVLQMLDDEVSWLNNFNLTRPRSRHRPESSGLAARRAADNTLCAGHLTLVRALLTAPGVHLREVGGKLVPLLLEVYLFPAAAMLQDERTSPVLETAVKAYNGKCCGTLSKQQAFALLQQLASGHPSNLAALCSRLIDLHHTPPQQPLRHWEVTPSMESRASCGFVGLRNGGATCYMNSVLQQLFLVPGIREDLLSVSVKDSTQDSLFHQLQTVFGHLLESELLFYEPQKFWESFRMDGRPVNIREQQDAFEFYTRLVEQVDDYLKGKGLDRVFAKRFEGVFSIQRLCQDCPHRFEREEMFLSLNLTVKKLDSLHSSLEQLVKGELLEGDNACYCDVCRVKGRAVVRTCIKAPPQVLAIQLKRFGYDFDNGRSVKYDDHYKFPWTLDLAPYTADYLAELEGSSVKKADSAGERERSTTPSPIKAEDQSTGSGGGEAKSSPRIPATRSRSRGTKSPATSSRDKQSDLDDDTEMMSPDKTDVRRVPTTRATSAKTASTPSVEQDTKETSDSRSSSGSADADVFPVTPTKLNDSYINTTLFDSKATRSTANPVHRKSSEPMLSSNLAESLGLAYTPPSTPAQEEAAGTGFATPTESPSTKRSRSRRQPPSSVKRLPYELVGVVVHSGQAAAGHYYSYIKDRRGDPLTNPNKGKWFKFNDTCVDVVEMTEEFLEHECFGGQYKARSGGGGSSSGGSSLPEERHRYWSGYLLFYERVEERGAPASRTPATAPRPRHNTSRSLRVAPSHSVRRTLNLNVTGATTPTTTTRTRGDTKSTADDIPLAVSPPTTPVGSQSHSITYSANADLARQAASRDRAQDRFARSSLSELRELMEEGEKRGIFSQQRLPPHILTSIVHHNLELYRNRSLYHQHYYEFVLGLCAEAIAPKNSKSPGAIQAKEAIKQEEVNTALMQITRLALSFFFNTYLRLKSRSETLMLSWCRGLEMLVQHSQASCFAAMQLFSTDGGCRYLQPLLLHAPEKMQRKAARNILTAVLEEAVQLMGRDQGLETELERLLTIFLSLLRDAVPAALHTSQHYFNVLHNFCRLGKSHCHLVLNVRGFNTIIQFLLGRDPEEPLPTSHALVSSSTTNNNNNDEATPTPTPLDTDRRWTSLQSQELGLLHASCAELIMSCDLNCLSTVPCEEESNVSMTSVGPMSPRTDTSSSRQSATSGPDSGESNMTSDSVDTAEEQLKQQSLKRSASPVKMDVCQSLPNVPFPDAATRSNFDDSSTPSNSSTFSTGDDSSTDPLKRINSRSTSNSSSMNNSSSLATGVSDCSKTLGYSDDTSSSSGAAKTSSAPTNSVCVSIPPPASVAVVLSGGAVSLQWLAVVVTAYTELVEHMPLMTTAIMAACHRNGPFSRAFLATVLSQYGSAPSHTLRELSHLIMEALHIADPLHGERVSAVLEGCVDSLGNNHRGLLDLIMNHYNSDVRRAYQCMKLCVSISGRFPHARDVLAGTSERWRFAVTWLTDTLHRSFETPQSSGIAYTSPLSNEGTHTNVFQRTTSAQMTLEEATTLLGQMEPLDMETETSGSGDGLVDIREDSPSPFEL